MNNQFQRILNLVKKTGDRLVVTDQDGENTYVVMDIDDYEMLVDSENMPLFDEDDYEDFDLHDEVEPEEGQTKEISEPQDIWNVMQSAEDGGETWDPSTLSEEELSDLEEQYQKFAARNIEQAIEEVVPEAPKVEEKPDIAEEEFYLEPIE